MAVNSARPSRVKIKPRFDSPEVFRLEQINGFESTSEYSGVEYRYNVVSNQGPAHLYVPAEGRDAIATIRPKVGEVIELLKYKEGNEVLWSARLVDEPQLPQPPQPGPRLLAPVPRTNGYVNGHANGHFAELPPAQAPQPPPAEAEKPVRGSSHLAQCLMTVIDAVIEASEHARQKNYSVTFLGSDIRTMANTLMMGDRARGGND